MTLFLKGVLAVAVSGCARLAPGVRETAVMYRESALSVRTQRKLVDDFQGRADGVNDIGGRWRTLAGAALSYVPEDAQRPTGRAAKFEVWSAGGPAVFETDLNRLDVSQARALAFYIQAEKRARDALTVALEDTRGKVVRVPCAAYLIEKGKWQQVLVPIYALPGLDLNSLKALRLEVDPERFPQGGFLVDEIAFRGDPDLFFESLRDNLYGFRESARRPAASLAGLFDDALLAEIAQDTWLYFVDLVDRRSEFPIDHLKLDPPREIGDYTSPTTIGLYYACLVGALELGLAERGWVLERLSRSLDSLERLPRWRGFFYNYYSTTNREITRRFVSTVDNAWLAAGLMVVRQTFPQDLGRRASRLLSEMGFGRLYDAKRGLLYIGIEVSEEGEAVSTEHHYGQLVSEARIASFIGIGKGDLPREHWFKLRRTLPAEWDWQTQVPKGRDKTYEGVTVFQGFYEVGGRKVVPSWGGSLFEFLMPTLFVNEQGLAPKSLGENNRVALALHREYALREKRYPVWGISPASYLVGQDSNYGEFGVHALGARGYSDLGVLTPHVSFLALGVDFGEAVRNLRTYLAGYDISGPYGFYDSVAAPPRARVHRMYLGLDQGMSFLALVNALKKNAIVGRFHADPIARQAESLLAVESFFE